MLLVALVAELFVHEGVHGPQERDAAQSFARCCDVQRCVADCLSRWIQLAGI